MTIKKSLTLILFAAMALLPCACLEDNPNNKDDGDGDTVDGNVPESDAGDTEPGDTENREIPSLRPIPADVALQLTAYVRRIRTQAVGSVSFPVAWAFVNWCCQERALTLEYAIATADLNLNGEPQTMDETGLTNERIQEIANHPNFDVGTINLTGPMVAEQVFLKPDGSEVAGEPYRIFWSYHHGVVINVDGALEVVDLSLGDQPVAIEAWYPGFVGSDVECFHLNSEEWSEVWVYWNSMVNGFELPPEPARLCGYTITPMFKFRWDQEIQSDQIRWTPSTMEVQYGSFLNVLADDSYGYDLVPEEAEVPLFVSRYTGFPFSVVCEWEPTYPFCT